MDNVGIYWDFENIHISLSNQIYGPELSTRSRFKPQPELVDIQSIMGFAVSLGRIAVNRAYANWNFLWSYSEGLQNYTIDLIQLFPRGWSGKNGADIRMCVDIIEDSMAFPHIQKFLVIGGDSDYITIAQRLRQKGKEVIGVGVRETTNRFWITACNEFKFYHNLLKTFGSLQTTIKPDSDEILPLEEARLLIRQAIENVTKRTLEPFVRLSALKPAMVQIDPSFDENSFGFTRMKDLILACKDSFDLKKGQYEYVVALNDTEQDNQHEPIDAGVENYRQALKRQQIRLVDPTHFSVLCEQVAVFAKGIDFESWDDFFTRAASHLQANSSLPVIELKKLRSLLFKANLFQVDKESGRISIQPDLCEKQAIQDAILKELIRRALSDAAVSWEAAALSRLIYGSEEHLARIETLRQSVVIDPPAAASATETNSLLTADQDELIASVVEPPASGGQEKSLLFLYRNLFRVLTIDIPHPSVFKTLCSVIVAVSKKGPFSKWSEFYQQGQQVYFGLDNQLQSEFKKMQNLIFKLGGFQKDPLSRSNALRTDLMTPDKLEDFVVIELIRKITERSRIEWDARSLCQLVYGSEERIAWMDAVRQKVLQQKDSLVAE